MTTTPMKRAGQLIAHLETLHHIRDVRQLMLLQLLMRERQDQAALFKRQPGESEQAEGKQAEGGQAGGTTLSLVGAQLSPPSDTLTHRAGSVTAAALMAQLQALSGIQGDDVAFSAGQIGGLIDAETFKIEQSVGLAKLDAALLALAGTLVSRPESSEMPGETTGVSGSDVQTQQGTGSGEMASDQMAPEQAEAPEVTAEFSEASSAQETDTSSAESQEDAELVSSGAVASASRSGRRRS